MIFQLFVNTNYNLIKIPFEAGIFDVKIIRIDINTTTGSAQVFRIFSNRIPFNSCEFRAYQTNAPILPQNTSRSGLFLPGTNNNGFWNGVAWNNSGMINLVDYTENPLLFKDVYLDGYIDTQCFGCGIQANVGMRLDDTPAPAGMIDDSRRLLILLDIVPKKIYRSII